MASGAPGRRRRSPPWLGSRRAGAPPRPGMPWSRACRARASRCRRRRTAAGRRRARTKLAFSSTWCRHTRRTRSRARGSGRPTQASGANGGLATTVFNVSATGTQDYKLALTAASPPNVIPICIGGSASTEATASGTRGNTVTLVLATPYCLPDSKVAASAGAGKVKKVPPVGGAPNAAGKDGKPAGGGACGQRQAGVGASATGAAAVQTRPSHSSEVKIKPALPRFFEPSKRGK